MTVPTNSIGELRNALFDTIRDLRKAEAPMEVDRGRAIAEVAQTVINSVKAETDFLRATGGTKGSGFIPLEETTNGPAAPPSVPAIEGKKGDDKPKGGKPTGGDAEQSV